MRQRAKRNRRGRPRSDRSARRPTLRLRPVKRLPGQPRLAHPSRSSKHDSRRTRRCERLSEQRQLLPPPHQRPRHAHRPTSLEERPSGDRPITRHGLARAGTAPDATPSLPRRRALRVTPVRRLDCARRATFSALADGCFAGTAESPETCRPSARKPAVEPCVWSGASIWPDGVASKDCCKYATGAVRATA
jgi:hypothetical protein